MAFYDALSNATNFVVGLSSAPRYECGIFARGYRHAAATVAEELLSRVHLSDYDAYPVVFLYRHAFELHLKNVIYNSARLSAFQGMAKIDAELHNTHALMPLARSAGHVLLKLFPRDDDIGNVVKRCKSVATELSDIDRDSYKYRYPIDKHGHSATRHHQVVNLQAFHRTMDSVLGDLEVIDFGLDVETTKAQEIYEILEELPTSLRAQ